MGIHIRIYQQLSVEQEVSDELHTNMKLAGARADASHGHEYGLLHDLGQEVAR